MNYQVNEIFYSIQGEGRNTGMPAIFIRFAGCNLSCEWCDTDYSRKFNAPAAIILTGWILKSPYKNIVLTGGEPTEQDLLPLLKQLKGYYVAIETNGTNSLRNYRDRGLIDWVTVSPKTQNIAVDGPIDELKVIYPTDLDFSGLARIRAKYRYVQPCDDEHYDENLKKTIEFVKENPLWRLSLQTHKILGLR